MVRVLVTVGTALYSALPIWLAVILHSPRPTPLGLPSRTMQVTPGEAPKPTARPEVAVASRGVSAPKAPLSGCVKRAQEPAQRTVRDSRLDLSNGSASLRVHQSRNRRSPSP